MTVRQSVDRARRAVRGVDPTWYYLDLVPSVRRAVLVVGSGRSGTTWLGEIVDRDHRYRTIFEPFRADKVATAGPFRAGEYLPPATDDPVRHRAATRILRGHVRSPWSDQFNRASVATRRIVKEIRITNLVPWIRRWFGTVPVLYVARHPFAVANSASRLGWDDELDARCDQSELFRLLDVDPEAVRAEARTPFARHVARWAIENAVMLARDPDPGVLMVSYEALTDDPEGQAGRIADFVGHPVGPVSTDLPSATAWRSDSALGTAPAAAAWLAQVAPADRATGTAVLGRFGLAALAEAGADPLTHRSSA